MQQRGEKFDEKSSYVLIGIRRAGKNYTLYQDILSKLASGKAKAEDILYIIFEDERVAPIHGNELGMLIEAYWDLYDQKAPYIYLDEILNIVGWEKFARRLAEEKRKVMITGSNARMLSHEIASTLGGRYIQRNIYPFSFREFLE